MRVAPQNSQVRTQKAISMKAAGGANISHNKVIVENEHFKYE